MNIEKAEVAKRFAKAHQTYSMHAFAQQNICQHLIGLIQQNLAQKRFDRVFEIGCGSGYLTKLLHDNFDIQQLYLNDLYAEVALHFDQSQTGPVVDWCIGDAEEIAYPPDLNLIVSSSALQWMTDLDHLFTKCHQAFVSSKMVSGYLCFSTFGQQNLNEIKVLTGQGLDYVSVDALRQKLEVQGFEVLHISEQLIPLYFEHPKQVLQHLKATGVTATAQKHRWTKQSLMQFFQDYWQFSQQNDQGNRQYQLTYHPIYVIARKKAQ